MTDWGGAPSFHELAIGLCYVPQRSPSGAEVLISSGKPGARAEPRANRIKPRIKSRAS